MVFYKYTGSDDLYPLCLCSDILGSDIADGSDNCDRSADIPAKGIEISIYFHKNFWYNKRNMLLPEMKSDRNINLRKEWLE